EICEFRARKGNARKETSLAERRKSSLRRAARAQLTGESAAASASERGAERGIPRWVVVAGLVIYCSLVWGIALEFGASALKNLLPDNNNLAQAKQAVPDNDASGR